MLKWLVKKVVQYAIEELYSSDMFRRLLLEAFRSSVVNRSSEMIPSVFGGGHVEEKDIDSLAVVAKAFGQSTAAKDAEISGDLSSSEKVVKSGGTKKMIDMLSTIGE
jgi:hypothetical protein